MAASNEWEYKHLTPTGWVQGSSRLDFQGVEELPTPENAVLTAYRKVYLGAIGAKPSITEEKTHLSSDTKLIEQLLSKYGPPKFGV